MLALIHALAARAGWLMPKWLIKRMEEEVRAFVEAMTLIAAQGAKLLAAQAEAKAQAEAEAEAEAAPQPVEAAATQTVGSARTGHRRSAAPRQRNRSTPRTVTADNPPEAAAARTQNPQTFQWPSESPFHRAAARHRPEPHPNPKIAFVKPAPWHAHFVVISLYKTLPPLRRRFRLSRPLRDCR